VVHLNGQRLSVASLKFSVRTGSEGLLISAVALGALPDKFGWEDFLEVVGDVANVAEVLTLGACAVTGVACAAVPFMSGLSTGLDAVNFTVDAAQGDWGEATLGAASLVGTGAVSVGAKAWISPAMVRTYSSTGSALRTGEAIGKSSEGFQAVVGGSSDLSIYIMSTSGMYSGKTDDGVGEAPYEMYQELLG
jgi:hypothetical protein